MGGACRACARPLAVDESSCLRTHATPQHASMCFLFRSEPAVPSAGPRPSSLAFATTTPARAYGAASVPSPKLTRPYKARSGVRRFLFLLNVILVKASIHFSAQLRQGPLENPRSPACPCLLLLAPSSHCFHYASGYSICPTPYCKGLVAGQLRHNTHSLAPLSLGLFSPRSPHVGQNNHVGKKCSSR